MAISDSRLRKAEELKIEAISSTSLNKHVLEDDCALQNLNYSLSVLESARFLQKTQSQYQKPHIDSTSFCMDSCATVKLFYFCNSSSTLIKIYDTTDKYNQSRIRENVFLSVNLVFK